jgi:hypothetical protein
MAIKKVHEFGDANDGIPPDQPRFSGPVIQEWFTRYKEARKAKGEDGIRDTAVPLERPYWRGSDSSRRCDRQLFYAMKGEPVTEDFTLADNYTFMLGETIHEMMQTHALAIWPDAEVEKPVDFRPDFNGAMSVDLYLPTALAGKPVAIEAKSMNGFGFKSQATRFNGPPEGPRPEHVVQMAMGVIGTKADAGAVVYWSLEKLSPSLASKAFHGETGRVAAEWWFTKDECLDVALTEISRIDNVLGDIANDSPPPRYLHRTGHRAPTALITDPTKGTWQVTMGDQLIDHGTTWHCDYCPFKTKCLADGAGDRLL